MTEPAPNLTTRRWWKYGLVAVAILFLATIGFLSYLTTDSFQSLVRRRLVEEIERITGGRAQVASIHTVPFHLQVELRDITVRGREAQIDIPLAHADAITARFKISSLLRSELAFNRVILDHPIVHVVFYPDGSSNFPPRTANIAGQTAVEKLFALSIDHFELRHGQLIWENLPGHGQSIPVDFTARDTSLGMDYSFLRRRYEGRLLLGQVDTKIPDCKPFAWMTAIEFTLSSDSALISSFLWNSGHSHISASGQITHFPHPHLQGPYEAYLDLDEVASIARRHDLRSGVLDLKGHGDWSNDHFSTNGSLFVQNLGFQDEQVSFSKASLTTGYSVSDQQLSLSKLQGKIFGGVFDGEAEINQWLAPAQHLSTAARRALVTPTVSAVPSSKVRAAPTKPSFQTATVRIRVANLSADELAAALDTPAHPFPTFHPAALLSGTFTTRWQGTPRDAEIQFDADLNPFSEAARGQLAVAAHASGVYRAATDSLDLPRLTLATPNSHLQASGTLSASSSVHLAVSTSSLADWLPFLSAVRGPELFPVTLNGAATFNGGMTGSLSAPRVFGALSAENLDINFPKTGRTQRAEMHWDSLSASMQLSFESLALHSGKLQRGSTSGVFDGSVSLQHGHITGDSAFHLRANLSQADLSTLQILAGFNYPVDGAGDVTLRAAGTLSAPHADGEIHLTNASAYGESIRQFDSAFYIDPGQIAFSNMHLFHEDSVITGNAAYHPPTRAFHLEIAGNNLDLAQFRRLQLGRISTEGRADFTLHASGTPQSPSIDGKAHIRALTLDHELAGDFDLQASTANGDLHLTGNSQFQHGSLALAGDIQLRNNEPANLSFHLDRLDLDSVLRPYIDGSLDAHSSVSGDVAISGPVALPAEWISTGNLTALSFTAANLQLQNQDPVLFSIARESLRIQKLRLAGNGTALTASGTVQLSGSRALDLTAELHADLKLLSTFDSNITATGLVSANLTVGGTLSDPQPEGHIHFADSAISHAGLPSGLTDLNGSLVFTRDRFHIDSLAARTGGGAIDLAGDATFTNRQLNFNLTGTARDVRLRYPPGVSSTANSQLHWTGSRYASTLSGDITVNKIAITPGFDFSSYLDRSRQLSSVTTANSPLNNVKLDIHVQTAPELQMRTAIARFSGDADLRIRGSIARPAVLGRADVLEGQATFHGTRFTLERGDITFTNPVAIEPQLNLQASTRVRDYDLDITITGTPDRGLNINYRSDPPLPKSDIVALLALGRSNEETAQLQGQSSGTTFSDQATAQILSEALNTNVTSRLQRLFGASNIKIDPQGLTTATNPISNGPQITIEQEFVNHFTILYSTNVSQTSEQIIQGEYYVNRNLSAVGTRDQNGVVSFDLRARTRKK